PLAGAQVASQLDKMTLSVLAVIPALAGMWAGQLIRDRISPLTFHRGFLALLFLRNRDGYQTAPLAEVCQNASEA
ncbi:hypothetical protein ACCT32_34520, partial [Rhizobium brockwellii]